MSICIPRPASFIALVLGCAAGMPLMAADRPAVLPDTMAHRMIPCMSCHARKEGSAFFPNISGKPAGYLYNQLVNFREGRRQYPLMTYMVDHLPDPYLHEIAEFFASEHLPVPVPVPKPANVTREVLERGRVLVTKGDPASKVPACIACHGDKLTGVAPAIPGLLGLPRDYLNAQFGAWRNKVRRALPPDCMAEITARLSPGDVAAVSSWLASQPVPADPRPAAASALVRPLPLECGSSPD
jgi:cytochrome c553